MHSYVPSTLNYPGRSVLLGYFPLQDQLQEGSFQVGEPRCQWKEASLDTRLCTHIGCLAYGLGNKSTMHMAENTVVLANQIKICPCSGNFDLCARAKFTSLEHCVCKANMTSFRSKMLCQSSMANTTGVGPSRRCKSQHLNCSMLGGNVKPEELLEVLLIYDRARELL